MQMRASSECKSVRMCALLVLQVWENCRMYNPVGTAVRQMGDRLSETWEKKWYQSGVEPRWEGLMRELTEEEVPPTPSPLSAHHLPSIFP